MQTKILIGLKGHGLDIPLAYSTFLPLLNEVVPGKSVFVPFQHQLVELFTAQDHIVPLLQKQVLIQEDELVWYETMFSKLTVFLKLLHLNTICKYFNIKVNLIHQGSQTKLYQAYL